jgi:transcriptional regulator with XRE-family HTH domain
MPVRKTALGDLIREVMTEKRLSLNDVAERSGGRIAKSRVAGIRDGDFKMVPPRETLEGLAEGLGLPFSVVRDSAVASLGGPARISEGDDLTILVAEANENLSAKQRKEWVRMARALLRSLADE